MGDQPSGSGSPSTPGLSQAQEGISTASQTLSFVQGVDQLFGNPISNAVQTRRRKAEKRALLGEWHDFLYDSKADVYYVPVLEKSQFWRYLTRVQGVLRPEGGCEATAHWAKLLYSLGITPKKAIASRVLRTPNPKENHVSDIVLELDGEIVCHVVNLYGRESSQRLVTVEGLRRKAEWPTSLGVFSLIQDANHNKVLAVTYKPWSDRSLATVKRPFAETPLFYGPQETDTLLAMYELALDLGTSDAAIAWPDKSSSLEIRTQAVLSNMDELWLTSRPTPDVTLVTTSWLDEPNRILRRVSTNGGTDGSFLADVLRLVDRYPVKEDTKAAMLRQGTFWVFCCEALGDTSSSHSPSPSPSIKSEALPNTYWYHYDLSPHGIVPGRSPNSGAWWRLVLPKLIGEVLEGYKEEEPGSWKKALHDNAEAVQEFMCWYEVLSGKRRVEVDSSRTCVIELDRSSRLWFVDGLQLQRAPSTPGAMLWPA